MVTVDNECEKPLIRALGLGADGPENTTEVEPRSAEPGRP
jgi:hypothetical protein